MRHDLRFHLSWLRGLALAAISALGIVAIVGSGGGSVGFPEYTGPGTGPQPPAPTAFVEPPYVTALVGTSVTFTAKVSPPLGSNTYQWARSFDGGKTFVDIAGATGGSYSLGGVTFADDAAVFQVKVRNSSSAASSSALGHLAVSATQGLVFEDGDFPPENWVASTEIREGAPSIVHSEQRVASGGNPGAFRQMTVQMASQSAGEIFHASRSAAYDPVSAGPIYVIDFEADCMFIGTIGSMYLRLMIEQAGRKYVASSVRLGERVTWDCLSTSWRQIRRSSLGSRDFTLADGPECSAGLSCPDFSAAGQPIRFGYQCAPSGPRGESITNGIDNWKVTVWKR